MKKQKRKNETSAEGVHPYQVLVGNLGQVYDGPSKKDAMRDYHYYVAKSASEFGGRVAGESVTLMINGEPTEEHAGWVRYFDDVPELVRIVNENRKKSASDCPLCGGTVQSGAPCMSDPDVKVDRKCLQCGFRWVEDYVFELAHVPGLPE